MDSKVEGNVASIIFPHSSKKKQPPSTGKSFTPSATTTSVIELALPPPVYVNTTIPLGGEENF